MSPLNISALTSRIRYEALRLGFAGIGIAPAGPLPRREQLCAWLQRGFHGEMRYMEGQAAKRKNPELLLANARSMLVLGWNYYTAHGIENSPLKGRISRYAWGDDYHFEIKHRLGKMLEYIKRQAPSTDGLCYVDTGPIMEKVWGARTALGWMGKHTNLISRKHGSWFFIGVILLDTGLEYDAPHRDYCGTCLRCMKSCPTGAIVEPYVLDARLCVSYMTIELRGAIPRPLRTLIGNRIYGCDDCQEVCPWNQLAAESAETESHPRRRMVMPDLVKLVRISPEDFSSRFKTSAIQRATRDGFVRNVVVALGNSGSADAVPALEEAMGDPSPLVRSHAAWALGQIATPRALGILDMARRREIDASVLEEITAALEKN